MSTIYAGKGKVDSYNPYLSLEVKQGSQDVVNNETEIDFIFKLHRPSAVSSSVSKKYNFTINGEKYSGTYSIGGTGTKTIKSGKQTINHNSDGKKTISFSINTQIGVTWSGTSIGYVTKSGSMKLTDIPRISELNVDNGTLGVLHTITANRNSDAFTHTLTWQCGEYSGTLDTNSINTSWDFLPAMELANEAPDGINVQCDFILTTYNGEIEIGTDLKSVLFEIPDTVIPDVNFNVYDLMGHADLFGAYVQSRSKFKINVDASGVYGSTIKEYKVEADGKTYNTNSVTTDVISGKDDMTIKVTVVDTRNRTSVAVKEVSVLPYSAPKINSISVQRCNDEGFLFSSGTHLKVSFDAEITSLDEKNVARYTVQYKKTSDAEYTPLIPQELQEYIGQYAVVNGTYVFAADKNSTYDILLQASDSFSSIPKNANGASVQKLWSIFKKKLGFAFGKIAELEGVLDVGFKTRFFGGILLKTLDDGTDVDTLKTSNIYKVFTDDGLLNLPESGVGGILAVMGSDDESSVQQQFEVSDKEHPRTYKRAFYNNTWGSWVGDRMPVTIIGLPSGSTYECFYIPTLMMCFLEINFTGKALSATTATTIGTIETGYIPSHTRPLTVYPIQDMSNELYAGLRNDGQIRVFSQAAKSTSDSIYISGFWFV